MEEGPRAVVKDISFGGAPGVTAGEVAAPSGPTSRIWSIR
jgi:hypothetical protein